MCIWTILGRSGYTPYKPISGVITPLYLQLVGAHFVYMLKMLKSLEKKLTIGNLLLHHAHRLLGTKNEE